MGHRQKREKCGAAALSGQLTWEGGRERGQGAQAAPQARSYVKEYRWTAQNRDAGRRSWKRALQAGGTRRGPELAGGRGAGVSAAPTPPAMPAPPSSLSTRHVVVAGAGGLGCPAALALAEAGVGRLTLLDPDVVESSNLPRQVLYDDADRGRAKALVAAERLHRPAQTVVGIHAALDETNENQYLADADLLLDATDGARTKDWLNALAVRRGLPFIHAAALRSEGRLLDVPPGGKPCLACLFGRLEEETGRCADLGVWNGAVGATGFLAAAAAVRRLTHPDHGSTGYLVLDLESGRAITLGAAPSSTCPVCADASALRPAALPSAAPCRVPTESDAPMVPPAASLDLREEVCPLNLLRARRAVEDLERGVRLEILLGEEGAASVPDGLRSLGHVVLEEATLGRGRRLVAMRGGRVLPADRLDRDVLLRFARQVVLPEVGEAGQARLLDARVHVEGQGPLADTAVLYLRAAGVGHVDHAQGARAEGLLAVARIDAEGGGGAYAAYVDGAGSGRVVEGDGAEVVGGSYPSAEARALGALLADRVERRIVLGGAPSLEIRIAAGPRIET